MPSSDVEQLILELINDARLDPLGNAARYISSYSPLRSPDAGIQSALTSFKVSGSALYNAYAALTPVQPLAFNDQLAAAATKHSLALIAADTQSHQVPGEADLGSRISAEGYALRSAGENVYAYAQNALNAHAGFMVDWGGPDNGMQSPPGHRNNIMSSGYREVGIGAVAESNASTSVGPLVVTQDFGRRALTDTLILGVAYSDADRNGFYSLGEGRSDLTVSVAGVSTTSGSSGGYTLQTSATGQQTITLANGGLTSPVSVTTALAPSQNLKIDIIGGTTLHISASALITGTVTEIDGIGVSGLSLTGDDNPHRIVGTVGNDSLTGGAGDDTIQGGLGTNVLVGGGGTDIAVYAIARNAATVTSQNGVTTITAAGINDTLAGFEAIRFADQTVSLGGTTPSRVHADLNGDKTSDVLFQSSASVVGWRVQNGQAQAATALGNAGSYRVVGTGDFNGDRTTDVLFQSGGSVVAWQMQNGQVQSSTGLGNAGSYQVVGTGDFNNDGTSDVLFQQGGSVVAWQMQNGQVQASTALGNAGSYQVVGTGDLNGDGTDDVVFQDGASVVAWIMGNGQVQSVANLGNAGGYRVAGVGDLNGDSRADLVFQNGASVVDWIMGSNAQVQSAGGLGNAGGYTVAGVGDYNGDGTADVLFQQGASVVAWGMQNGQVQSLLNLGNAGDYAVVA